MQILPVLTEVFRITRKAGRRFAHAPAGKAAGALTEELDRILYGMQMHEQFVARKVIAMAGQTVPVRKDTVGIGNRHTPRYLKAGMQVKIAANPLVIDHQGELLINVFDAGHRPLAIRLSDYIQDIDTNSPEPETPDADPAGRAAQP